MLGVKSDSNNYNSVGVKHNTMSKHVVGEKNTVSMKPSSGYQPHNSGNASTDIFNTSNSMLAWSEPLVGIQKNSIKGF